MLLIYRINRMGYKAVIHLLCSETALYTSESLLAVHGWDAELLGTGASVTDLLCTESCTSLLFPGSPKPKRQPCSGGSPAQEHMNSESHVSECPVDTDPEELKKSNPLLLWSMVMQDVHMHCTRFDGERVAWSNFIPCLPTGRIWSIKHYFKSLEPVTSITAKIS